MIKTKKPRLPGLFLLWAIMGLRGKESHHYSHPTIPTHEWRDGPATFSKAKPQLGDWGFLLVGDNGLEPSTFAMSTQCSNQLS